jgi:hypothetical protein
MEIHKLLSCHLSKSFKISNHELWIWWLRRRQQLTQLVLSPEIILQIHIKLWMNCLHLSLHTTFFKKRKFKEMAKSIKSPFKMFISDSKEIICVSWWCVCISHAWVFRNEMLILWFIGVLISTHKEHVFAKMSKSLGLWWILKCTNLNIQGSSRFFCFFIFNQQTLKLIG